MNRPTFKEHSTWLSQVTAAAALIVVVYVKSKYVFESGNSAVLLIWIAMLAAVLTLIFSIASLPRWQGFVALAIFSYVAYCILFTPMYAIS